MSVTITPRIGVSAIEFIRSKDGSEDREIVCVPLDVCQKLMNIGGQHHNSMSWKVGDDEFSHDVTLSILRQEAEK